MIDKLKGFLPLLLFDDECVVCNRCVQFILQHQNQTGFFFSSLQSAVGQLIEKSDDNLILNDTLIVVTDIMVTQPVVRLKSDAVLFITAHLKYPWRLLLVFRILPHFIADWFYDFVAAHRYKIWGRAEKCLVPGPAQQQRFIYTIEDGPELS